MTNKQNIKVLKKRLEEKIRKKTRCDLVVSNVQVFRTICNDEMQSPEELKDLSKP